MNAILDDLNPFDFESVVPATTAGPAAASKAPSGVAAGSLFPEPVVLPSTVPAAAPDHAPAGAAAGFQFQSSDVRSDEAMAREVRSGVRGEHPHHLTGDHDRFSTPGVDQAGMGSQRTSTSEAFVLVERSLVENIFRFVQAAAHRERLGALPAFLRAPSRDHLDAVGRE